MGHHVQTLEWQTGRPDRIVDALSRHSSDQPSTGVLFVSGALSTVIPEIAQGLAVECRSTSWLIMPSAGVLSERGEIEGDSAAVALLLDRPAPLFTAKDPDPTFGDEIADLLAANPGASALVGVRGDDNDEAWLRQLDRRMADGPRSVIGGGTLPLLDVYSIHDGQVRWGKAGCVLLPTPYLGRFRSSSACRLISPLRKVTRSRGPILHELEGAPALERLTEATENLQEHPLVMVAVGAGEAPLSPTGRSLALRAIQGIDPNRGALMMGEEIPVGSRVAFAVRDAHASRVDLEAQLMGLRTHCAGSSPEFGVFISCAGRGSGLYGAENVDVRLIKKVFPNMPLVGMHSTFELAPFDGRTVSQIYTGVLGVFSLPS